MTVKSENTSGNYASSGAIEFGNLSDNKQQWWKVLPENIAQNHYKTPIDNHHKIKIKSTATIDKVLRTGLSTSLFGSMATTFFSSVKMKKDIENLNFYKDAIDNLGHEDVFKLPPSDICVTQKIIRLPYFAPKNAIVEQVSFVSTYQTLNPSLRESYEKSHGNQPVVGQHWKHPDGPRPTLIFTHGIGVNAFWINSLSFSLRWLFDQGYDILLHTLPFHGSRKTGMQVVGGMGLTSNGLSQMNESFLQGAYDLRVWMNHLENQGVETIGAAGYSLGGYTTAQVASCDNRLKFAIAICPAVLLMDMVAGWPPLSFGMNRIMKKTQLSLTDLRHRTAIHSPLSWKPLLEPERLMIIGGAADRFTPPQFVNAMSKHWAGSSMHWFPGGHIIHNQQSTYLNKMKDFMDKACCLNEYK